MITDKTNSIAINGFTDTRILKNDTATLTGRMRIIYRKLKTRKQRKHRITVRTLSENSVKLTKERRVYKIDARDIMLKKKYKSVSYIIIKTKSG